MTLCSLDVSEQRIAMFVGDQHLMLVDFMKLCVCLDLSMRIDRSPALVVAMFNGFNGS